MFCLVIFVAVLQFKSGRDYPVKINVSFLMRDAGEMDANTGCLPTSIKSLNDRFYQMKPESNTCNKKIPASFTEVYEAPTNVSPDFKRFVLNRSAPILVTIGRNPLDKNSFGVIISNLNKAGVKTFDKTYRNSDPVPFNGDSLFLGFKTYNYG
uniref:Uncharacterized protein n=1 Tax=mine drainage metagenome TaxID=410659 RepID=E6QLV6_9ZZZZ